MPESGQGVLSDSDMDTIEEAMPTIRRVVIEARANLGLRINSITAGSLLVAAVGSASALLTAAVGCVTARSVIRSNMAAARRSEAEALRNTAEAKRIEAECLKITAELRKTDREVTLLDLAALRELSVRKNFKVPDSQIQDLIVAILERAGTTLGDFPALERRYLNELTSMLKKIAPDLEEIEVVEDNSSTEVPTRRDQGGHDSR